jgi:hypothetical protein
VVVVRDRDGIGDVTGDLVRGIGDGEVLRRRGREGEGRAGVRIRDRSSCGRGGGGGVVVVCGVAGRDGWAGGVLRGWGLIARSAFLRVASFG